MVKNSFINIWTLLFDYVYNFYTYGIWGNRICLESSTLCQLRCPLCLHSSDDLKILGKGYLKFKDFKNFVDSYPHFKIIELSRWGEMFLNPELGDIIQYAHRKEISLTAKSGVNLNTASDDILEMLVTYQFKTITVSIDGASQATYQMYRYGGHFDSVISNIEKINYYKQKYNSRFPLLYWQFILFGHNEHELPRAREMAKDLHMHFKPHYNIKTYYSPLQNEPLIKRELGVQSLESYEQKNKILDEVICSHFWASPQINWDGRLLGCCANFRSDFGNVFEEGLKECMQSEKYRYAKKMLMGKRPPREDIPCFSCKRFNNRRNEKKTFRPLKMISKIGLLKVIKETLAMRFDYREIGT